MRRSAQLVMGIGAIVLLSGCQTSTRVATRVTEQPRVDLSLEGGNRGYLVGTPPPAPELKTTRQMVETTIELPTFYRSKRSGAQATLESNAPEASAVVVGGGGEAAAAPQQYDSYAVQKGDSLWSIAAKPEIYGKASAWHRIYDANRDILKSPNRLKAGMTLKIPRGEGASGGTTTYGSDGITYKK